LDAGSRTREEAEAALVRDMEAPVEAGRGGGGGSVGCGCARRWQSCGCWQSA
jgi:hypothetical protein